MGSAAAGTQVLGSHTPGHRTRQHAAIAVGMQVQSERCETVDLLVQGGACGFQGHGAPAQEVSHQRALAPSERISASPAVIASPLAASRLSSRPLAPR